MILIADSGSSKTDWRLIDDRKVSQFQCKGLNPDFNSIEDVHLLVKETFESAPVEEVKQVFFYGSGCSSEARNAIIESGLKKVFRKAEINIYHDLLGAARAACGKEAGLSGILGTGSNCCLFNGTEIVREYRTGGFILGDEGGGVDIGKKLVKYFIEEKLPKELQSSFYKRFGFSVDEILQKLYKESYPNRFLASFSQFAYHHKENGFIAALLKASFTAYFDEQVLRYIHDRDSPLPLNIVGSVAFYYQEFIRNIASEKGVRVGTILEKPISGLTLYHADLS